MFPNDEENMDERMPLDAGICMEIAGIEADFEMDTPTATNYDIGLFRKHTATDAR